MLCYIILYISCKLHFCDLLFHEVSLLHCLWYYFRQSLIEIKCHFWSRNTRCFVRRPVLHAVILQYLHHRVGSITQSLKCDDQLSSFQCFFQALLKFYHGDRQKCQTFQFAIWYHLINLSCSGSFFSKILSDDLWRMISKDHVFYYYFRYEKRGGGGSIVRKSRYSILFTNINWALSPVWLTFFFFLVHVSFLLFVNHVWNIIKTCKDNVRKLSKQTCTWT